jgi:hypothetical protein
MSMDERLPVKSCMYGCHSEFDKYREGDQRECAFDTRQTERACIGCAHIGSIEEQKGEA